MQVIAFMIAVILCLVSALGLMRVVGPLKTKRQAMVSLSASFFAAVLLAPSGGSDPRPARAIVGDAQPGSLKEDAANTLQGSPTTMQGEAQTTGTAPGGSTLTPAPAAAATPSAPVESQAAAKPVISPAPSPEPKPSKWRYSTYEDEMTSKESKYACVEARESLYFDFPYGGGSTVEFCVRRHPRYGLDTYVTVSKGHFLCTSYDGCNVLIRFDDANPRKFSANAPADRSITTLFIRSSSALIKSLKSADVMRISAEFYQQGNRVMTFDVSGLEWSSK
jgi:hypothetical protein